MPKRRRSPQEKKRISLARDRPVSSEYPKSFRKQWPRKKAFAERARRTAERQALTTDPGGFAAVPRRRVVKWGTITLGEKVAVQLERRAALREQPRNSAAARERRRKRRGRRQASK